MKSLISTADRANKMDVATRLGPVPKCRRETLMALIELADSVTLDEVKAKTEAEFRVALKNA